MYAIWLPILAGDSRGAWDAHVLDDPRVVSLWDGSRLAGRWFADHSIGGLGAPGDIIWDAYLAFGQNSRWRSEPSGVLASGSDIIDNTGGLEQHFIPLLARGRTAVRRRSTGYDRERWTSHAAGSQTASSA